MKMIRSRSVQVGLAVAASAAMTIIAACGGDSTNLGSPDGSAGSSTVGSTGSTSTGVGNTSNTTGNTTGVGTTTTGGSTSTGTSTTAGGACPTPGPTCCLQNTDCTRMGLGVCNTTNNRCVQCTPADATGCAAAMPVCSPSTDTCQASCAVDGGAACRGGRVCDTTSGACVGCLPAATGTMPGVCPAATPVCNPTTQNCQQCSATDKTACTGARTMCNTTTGTCVACLVNSDCTMAGTPICRNGACVAGCMTNAECPLMGQPATDTVCNTTNNTCTACLMNSDCAGRTSVADGGGVPLSVCRTGGVGGGGTCVACIPGPADAGTPQGCTAGQTCMVVGGVARCM